MREANFHSPTVQETARKDGKSAMRVLYVRFPQVGGEGKNGEQHELEQSQEMSESHSLDKREPRKTAMSMQCSIARR